MRRMILGLCVCAISSPVAACDTALVLALDVSGSISPNEYRLQIDGLAEALTDPAIVAALVAGQDALAIVQWSGEQYQDLSLPWQRAGSVAEMAALAEAVRGIKRPGNFTATAIGQSILFSLAVLDSAPTCRRKVIDVSGDGKENDGMTLPDALAAAETLGVTINGLAIEVANGTSDLTAYYRGSVVTTDGFVMTAKGLKDYPRAIHEKLLRELTKPVS